MSQKEQLVTELLAARADCRQSALAILAEVISTQAFMSASSPAAGAAGLLGVGHGSQSSKRSSTSGMSRQSVSSRQPLARAFRSGQASLRPNARAQTKPTNSASTSEP